MLKDEDRSLVELVEEMDEVGSLVDEMVDDGLEVYP